MGWRRTLWLFGLFVVFAMTTGFSCKSLNPFRIHL